MCAFFFFFLPSVCDDEEKEERKKEEDTYDARATRATVRLAAERGDRVVADETVEAKGRVSLNPVVEVVDVFSLVELNIDRTGEQDASEGSRVDATLVDEGRT